MVASLNSNPTTTRSLSTDDLKAMRQCDTVSFHTNPTVSHISCHKRAKDGPWHSDEQTYDIEVDATIDMCAWYGHDSSRRTHTMAFAVIHTCRLDQNWRLLVDHVIRAGDSLSLYWLGDNNNQYVENTSLHHDELHVAIQRGGKRLGRFHLYTSLCPDNTARMIRP